LAQIKLSLLQPWIGSKDGSVVLRLGYTPAMVQEGSGQFPGKNQIIPGKEITVTLHPQEGKDAALIDEDVAKLWFGDWTAHESREGQGEFRVVSGPRGQMRSLIPTIAEEAERVSRNWGDERRASERGMKQDAIGFPTGEAIGPAQVPHVKVESVDAAGLPDGIVSYEPWDFLGYNTVWPDFDELAAGPKVLFDNSRRR
jgi:hypothetical protein